LSFRLNKDDKKGYLFRSIFFDEKKNLLYTTQAPLKGDSYITKWNVNNGFKPIDSAKICNVSTCSIDLDYNTKTLAIGDNKGSVIYIDANSLDKNKEINISELSIKTLKYYNENLISGCADNSIRVLGNFTKGIFTFVNLFKILLFAFILNIGVLLHKDNKFGTFAASKLNSK